MRQVLVLETAVRTEFIQVPVEDVAAYSKADGTGGKPSMKTGAVIRPARE
jgi:hypothetical protein